MPLTKDDVYISALPIDVDPRTALLKKVVRLVASAPNPSVSEWLLLSSVRCDFIELLNSEFISPLSSESVFSLYLAVCGDADLDGPNPVLERINVLTSHFAKLTELAGVEQTLVHKIAVALLTQSIIILRARVIMHGQVSGISITRGSDSAYTATGTSPP